MSERIKTMFGEVAPGYDRANQVLSLGTHHRWRRRAVRASGIATGQSVLDCATGTGDLALAFKRAVGSTGRVVGLDFARPMITLARAKSSQAATAVVWTVGDVLRLPFGDNEFDASSIAFGIRNVDDPVAGIAEMARVVRPGGVVVVLEFGQPSGSLFGPLYRLYARLVIPVIGGVITRRPGSYRYLTESSAAFPAGDAFRKLMQETGAFSQIRYEPLTFGIAYAYLGTVA